MKLCYPKLITSYRCVVASFRRPKQTGHKRLIELWTSFVLRSSSAVSRSMSILDGHCISTWSLTCFTLHFTPLSTLLLTCIIMVTCSFTCLLMVEDFWNFLRWICLQSLTTYSQLSFSTFHLFFHCSFSSIIIFLWCKLPFYLLVFNTGYKPKPNRESRATSDLSEGDQRVHGITHFNYTSFTSLIWISHIYWYYNSVSDNKSS